MNRRVVISGCSGGGKSTLLDELARRGYRVVAEPGRRIVASELQANGTALPWHDLHAFLHRAVDLALVDLSEADVPNQWVFFDRGLIDAVSGLEHLTGKPVASTSDLARCYHHRVFMTPPWPEIYVQDAERRHDIDSAIAEYERLMHMYFTLGYELQVLPKISVHERADHVLRMLDPVQAQRAVHGIRWCEPD
ncbi:AAA family ATPase [Paraburkholderia caribensis]|uniref:AAA family ATPase n=1 Tax=Paraburkholderia caribensis TaxID=75105 RepID=UPI002863847D|nr:AAA family ATPase [Paraburkholderia caribensis]MDR6380483.1 putative ATPase [Paraburkholderia caribensis]